MTMDVFKLVGSIFIKNDEANDKIDDTTEKAKSSSGKLGKAFGAMAKGVTVAVGACATGIGVISKQAISAYADYEQLVGGVETLFKESANIITKYADEAYINAGLSANKYMETVTSFSASLLQSLDGDTAKSAEYANRAIIDMADNANKMGSSIESLQTAYSGFSKQNYTMLDNLKLGYGGTKEEMARLIKDASEMTDVQEKLGITVDESSMSFGNIVNAISVMQDKMGIAGATANEASTTISGSLSALKGAWENTLIAMGNDSADFDAVIGKLVESATTAFGNLLPRIQVIFNAIPQLITQLAPQIPAIVQTLLPSLLNSSVNLLTALASQIPSLIGILASTIQANLPMILETVGSMVVGMANYIQTNLSVFVSKAQELVSQFGQKIEENLPTLISKGLDILLGLSQTILTNLPLLVLTGMNLIKSLVQGIINSLPELIVKAPEIISNLANSFNASMSMILVQGVEIIWNLIKGLVQSIPDLIANIGEIIEAIIAVWGAINWMKLGKNMMTSIKDGIKNLGGNLKSTVSNIFQNIKNAILHPIQTAKSTLTGILDAIKNKFSTVFSSAQSIVSNAIKVIKNLFNFSWKLPDLKMPHFTVSGGKAPWGFGGKGSLPSVSVEWYKEGGIMTEPTIFGYNPSTGKAMVGGEAGDEAIAPIELLQDYVANAVASQNDGLVVILNKVLEAITRLDKNMGGHLREALDGTSFEMNKREFARLVKVVY